MSQERPARWRFWHNSLVGMPWENRRRLRARVAREWERSFDAWKDAT